MLNLLNIVMSCKLLKIAKIANVLNGVQIIIISNNYLQITNYLLTHCTYVSPRSFYRHCTKISYETIRHTAVRQFKFVGQHEILALRNREWLEI